MMRAHMRALTAASFELTCGTEQKSANTSDGCRLCSNSGPVSGDVVQVHVQPFGATAVKNLLSEPNL